MKAAARFSPFVLLLVLGLAFHGPGQAQETEPRNHGQRDDGDSFSLMEEGARLLMRGLMQEMAPAMDEMERSLGQIGPAMRELGPQLQELARLIDDIRNYEAPVVLPNGDILIRRKPASRQPVLPVAPGPNGEIEL